MRPFPLTPTLYTFVSISSFYCLSLTYRTDALELYIQSQKAFLARTPSVVDRLRLLREHRYQDNFLTLSKKRFFFDYFRHEPQLNDNVFHFDHQRDISAEV